MPITLTRLRKSHPSAPGERFPKRRTYAAELPGQTPGSTELVAERDTLAPGSIRRLRRDHTTGILPAPLIAQALSPFVITKGLRYRASSVWTGVGNKLSDAAPRPVRSLSKTARLPRIPAGNAPGRPVIRNRLRPYGQRVPSLNAASAAAEELLP